MEGPSLAVQGTLVMVRTAGRVAWQASGRVTSCTGLEALDSGCSRQRRSLVVKTVNTVSSGRGGWWGELEGSTQ